MALEQVTVFGGSGFIGGRIVQRLTDRGSKVRVAVRRPERVERNQRIEVVRADVWDEASVPPAIEGSSGVVNTVGHYVEGGGKSFEGVHGQGALHVARACAATGVRRLVHISGLGADQPSPSPYVQARAKGEELVREAFPRVTILRPSVVFGSDDAFLNRLAGLVRSLPVIPLFGRGQVRMQPVFVGDVAEAVAVALEHPEAPGSVYELGGPGTYSYAELLRLIAKAGRHKRLLLPFPYSGWNALAVVLSVLPNPPITRDQVTLMRRANVVGRTARGLPDLGIEPTPLEQILPGVVS